MRHSRRMAALRVDSNQDGSFLLIDRSSRRGYYTAELRCRALQAAVDFYGDDSPPVGDLFAEIATDWRGWEGKRTWSSLEGEIQLIATHDRLATVALTVEVRSDVHVAAGYLWSATGLLFLDAGALAGLARQAGNFLG
jgi:hypothetical protein